MSETAKSGDAAFSADTPAVNADFGFTACTSVGSVFGGFLSPQPTRARASSTGTVRNNMVVPTA